MNAVVLGFPGNHRLAGALAQALDAVADAVCVRAFPDGESYVRLPEAVAGRAVVLTCTLERPDAKTLPLLFAAATARELGATAIGLVAPYLAYMRQDARFRPGEAVTSVTFARLLSGAVDWLVTVDPHLHRHAALGDVYTIPTATLTAAPALAAWIRTHVPRPVLLGPDSESAQWVTEVARLAAAPCLVLRKARRGDAEVEVSVPDVERWRDRTPVLVDDIISTAGTMIAAIAHLRGAGLPAPICVGVHAVFADGALERLLAAGAARVVTTSTIPHATGVIDVTASIAAAVRGML